MHVNHRPLCCGLELQHLSELLQGSRRAKLGTASIHICQLKHSPDSCRCLLCCFSSWQVQPASNDVPSVSSEPSSGNCSHPLPALLVGPSALPLPSPWLANPTIDIHQCGNSAIGKPLAAGPSCSSWWSDDSSSGTRAGDSSLHVGHSRET